MNKNVLVGSEPIYGPPTDAPAAANPNSELPLAAPTRDHVRDQEGLRSVARTAVRGASRAYIRFPRGLREEHRLPGRAYGVQCTGKFF